jgi:hypothetical protein
MEKVSYKERLQFEYDNYIARSELATKFLDLLKKYKSDWSKRLATYLEKNGMDCYYSNYDRKELSLIYLSKKVTWHYGEDGTKKEVIEEYREHERISLSTYFAGDKSRQEVIDEMQRIADYKAPELKHELDHFEEIEADINDAKRIIAEQTARIEKYSYTLRRILDGRE